MDSKSASDSLMRGEIVLLKFSVTDLAADAAAAAAAAAAASSSAAGLAGQFRIDSRTARIFCAATMHRRCQHGSLHWRLSVRANETQRRLSLLADDRVADLTLQATHCAGCKESFGLMRSKHACAQCSNIFCASLNCMEGMSLRSGAAGRVCVSCAEARDIASPPSFSPLQLPSLLQQQHQSPLDSPIAAVPPASRKLLRLSSSASLHGSSNANAAGSASSSSSASLSAPRTATC